MVEHLIGIHDFKGRSADELDISKGDYIEVIEDDAEFGDSWYIGRNLSTNKTGLFPKVFTTEAVPSEPQSNDITATLSDIDQALYEISAQSSASPESVMYWTPYDVRSFFVSRQYSEGVAEKFVHHRITGAILLQMDAVMLKELDIPSFGTRFELAKEIAELRELVGWTPPAGSAPVHAAAPGDANGSAAAERARMSSVGSHGSFGIGSPPGASAGGAAFRHSRQASAQDSMFTAMPPPNMAPGTPASSSFGGSQNGSSGTVNGSNGKSNGTNGANGMNGTNGHHRRQSSVSSILSTPNSPAQPPPGKLGRADSKNDTRFKNLKNASTQYLKPTLVKQKTSAFLEGIRDTTAEESAKTAQHSGWMQKRGGGVGSWKGRFFTLHGTRLSYFTNFKDTKERGLIDITGHKAVPFGNEDKLVALHAASFGAGKYGFKLLPPGPGYKKGVSFTAPKIHHFVVETEEEMHRWLQALMKATIERDESVAAVSSCTTPVVSLPKAQEMVAERLAMDYYEDESELDQQN